MSARSVFTLLRFPFGVFLAPISLFGLVSVVPLDPLRVFLILICIHFFLYPASNGLNSYYDRDLDSIGGLKKPPMPTRGLLRASLILDLVAVLLGLVVSPWFALGLFVYGLFSKAYSWDRIRLKNRPVLSLMLIALGQGSLIYLLCAWWGSSMPYLPAVVGQHAGTSLVETGAALGGFMGPVGVVLSPKLLFGALLSALFLLGVYPLTQVYQHDEDEARGDLSFSRLVGIQGTFKHSAFFFSAAGIGFIIFFYLFETWLSVALFALCMLPGTIVFLLWWRAVLKDPTHASFSWMMRMNITAATGMNLYLIIQLAGIPRL